MKKSPRGASRRSIFAALACSAILAGILIGAVATPAGALAAQSVVLVKDILPGTSSSTPTQGATVGSTLYFRATDGTAVGVGHGVELWKSDGTTAGTTLVKDINPGTGSSTPVLMNFNGTLFFSATDGANGVELWTSDGTTSGTVMVKDINPGSGSSTPANFTPAGSIMFFTINSGASTQLWKTDGTAANTVLV